MLHIAERGNYTNFQQVKFVLSERSHLGENQENSQERDDLASPNSENQVINFLYFQCLLFSRT